MWLYYLLLRMPKESSRGFTLIEVILIVGILATLATLAVPTYLHYIDKARNIGAVAGIRFLEKDIMMFELEYARLPLTLDEIGEGNLGDPWGNPYPYLTIADGAKNKIRKDKFLHPLNSDYDLYSSGKDGKSKAPLTAHDSWDDIIRANDGDYVGLASGY